MAIQHDSKTERKTPREPRPSSPEREPRKNERLAHDLFGIALAAIGILIFVCLVISKSDSGLLGADISTFFKLLFGVGAYLVPVLLLLWSAIVIIGAVPAFITERYYGVISLWLIFLATWDYFHAIPHDHWNPNHVSITSGFVGAGIDFLVTKLLGAASPVLYFSILLGCAVWMADRRLLSMIEALWESAQTAHDATSKAAEAIGSKLKPTRRPAKEFGALPEALKKSAIPSKAKVRFKAEEDAEAPTVPAPRPTPEKPAPEPIKPFPVMPQPLKPIIIVQKPLNLDRLGEVEDSFNKNYQLPPLDILIPSKPIGPEVAAGNVKRQEILMQTLNEFKIGANVKQVAMGPTITRYEVALEPGILVRRIVALADNLAMALAAIDVRVEAPIPGKSAIGIEVPNEIKQIVTLRETIDTQEFVNSPSKLTFALGKDVAGHYMYADLAKMPHVLVGGSTNSGKSSCLNALISSILYRATPREVRFVMIDPKRVELSLYDGIPHLLSPVIKDTRQAAGILRSVLVEMDKRYNLFSEKKARNIESYNNQMDEKHRLPFIVVIIDELADLMMTQGADVETCIARLTALARATGIHLVIATQRPSVDVVTGTIKANITSRIAFAVSTQIDSRTILDCMGADRLIGRGDMLYLPIGASKPVRIQGCYVTEKETVDLVKYLRDQEEPRYTMTPTAATDGFSDEADDGDTDELFEPAVRWLSAQHERGASTSSLQRRFKIGYTRAARLIETMEARGIVGAQEGVKPREVLLHPANLEAYFSGKSQGMLFDERSQQTELDNDNDPPPFDED